MCLDPRPDSLVRIRPSAGRPVVTAAAATASNETRRARRPEREPWLSTLAESLDSRGWTLVTRAATHC